MGLKLEVGKVYVNKYGDKVEIVHHIKGCLMPGERPMVGVKESRGGSKEVICYERDGSVPNSSLSLIKPAPHPHPHAESMLLYAQDAAECEKPWLRWECSYQGNSFAYVRHSTHPTWFDNFEYRRLPPSEWPPEAF